jgi:serine/threonine protein kinase
MGLHMEPSVEALCNGLARSRLLPPEDVRKLRRRWLEEAGPRAADLTEFSRWLVDQRYVTAYQVAVVRRGRGDSLFLDPYTILERIGKGRMAGVYKAIYRLGPTVAIKILPPSKAKDPQLLARFQREARLALALKHPNVVRTFQTGQADGLHYLVMEYLEGETLDDVLRRRGRLPPAEAVRLIYQALLGLEHLHEQGLVHRDLKPGNLMLVPGPREVAGPGQPDTTLRRIVKILDIGTGRALFADDMTEAGTPFELTTETETLGTPDYMAPEQARDPHAADIRADIYSLGCVLYHTLAGQPPFPEANLVRKMVRHATEVPAPLKALNSEVPDGLQQIVDWMLAKDPARRYPTPLRAAQALQVFLAAGSETLETGPLEPTMRAYLQWLEQHGGAAAAPPAPAAAPAGPGVQPAPRPAAGAGGRAPAKRSAAGAGQTQPRPSRPKPPSRKLSAPVAGPSPDVEIVLEPVARQASPAPGQEKAGARPSRNWKWLIVALVGALLLILLLCGGIVGLIVYVATR